MNVYPRIGALIPVRLRSERLPGKALLPLADRPMITHLLDRVAACRHIADARDVVVCTTTDESDDLLVSAVESHGCSVFRGSVDDIIRRFGEAMIERGFDAVVQADGDDPLSATEYMDLTMDRLLADPSIDIVTIKGVPLGTATKSFTRRAMDKVLAAYRTERNDTGFIYFFTKSGLCRHVEIDVIGPQHVHPTARLTLDYEVDLALFRRIFEALYKPGQVFGLAEVVALLNAQPELVNLNRHVEKEYWQRTAKKAVLEFCAADSSVQRIQL